MDHSQRGCHGEEYPVTHGTFVSTELFPTSHFRLRSALFSTRPVPCLLFSPSLLPSPIPSLPPHVEEKTPRWENDLPFKSGKNGSCSCGSTNAPFTQYQALQEDGECQKAREPKQTREPIHSERGVLVGQFREVGDADEEVCDGEEGVEGGEDEEVDLAGREVGCAGVVPVGDWFCEG